MKSRYNMYIHMYISITLSCIVKSIIPLYINPRVIDHYEYHRYIKIYGSIDQMGENAINNIS